MLFCQVWTARRAARSNLTKPQTFPLENACGSDSGLRISLVFWMSLYKDYFALGHTPLQTKLLYPMHLTLNKYLLYCLHTCIITQ